jgi:HSP20 family molecular chaperone IbpA
VTSPHQSTTSAHATPSVEPRSERPEQTPRRFIIRADVYYDAESKVITAMLELPGVKKTDLNVKLSTCWYNRVKQVIVTGKSRSVFPDEKGFAVRERKHGEFARTFAVPPDTRVRALFDSSTSSWTRGCCPLCLTGQVV